MNPKIITFQLTPFDKTTEDTINSISEAELYSIFNQNKSPTILSAALYRLFIIENKVREGMNSEEWMISYINKEENWIIQETLKQCPITNFKLTPSKDKSFFDVYLRDWDMFNNYTLRNKIIPNVFILLINGIYSGHIYAWKVPISYINAEVTNVIGIRASIMQILLNKCNKKQPNIARIFLSAIRDWSLSRAAPNTIQYMRIIHPIGPMPRILKDCGFARVGELPEKILWLYDNDTFGGIIIPRNSLRDYDYIGEITRPLICEAPEYIYEEIA